MQVQVHFSHGPPTYLEEAPALVIIPSGHGEDVEGLDRLHLLRGPRVEEAQEGQERGHRRQRLGLKVVARVGGHGSGCGCHLDAM